MRPWKIVYRIACGAVLVFLLLPILAVIPLSFSSSGFLSYPLPGLSLRWYETVLTSGRWLDAFINSLKIGLSATALALLLGTTASFGLARRRGFIVGAIKLLALTPMIVPIVMIAVALYFFLAPLQLTNSFAGMVIAHTVIAIPFVVIPVLAAVEQLDPNLARAAAACGARPLTAFFRVTLPSIVPAVASGALFAFAASFDDVVIALFIAGPEQRTLPREMFSSLRETITPELTAVATIMMVFSTFLFMLMRYMQRRRRRLINLAAQGVVSA